MYLNRLSLDVFILDYEASLGEKILSPKLSSRPVHFIFSCCCSVVSLNKEQKIT